MVVAPWYRVLVRLVEDDCRPAVVVAVEAEAADDAEACDEANEAIETDVVAAASPAEAAFAVCSSDEADVASARFADDDDVDNYDDNATEDAFYVS